MRRVVEKRFRWWFMLLVVVFCNVSFLVWRLLFRVVRLGLSGDLSDVWLWMDNLVLLIWFFVWGGFFLVVDVINVNDGEVWGDLR